MSFKKAKLIYTLAPNENWICDRLVKEWNEGNSDICTQNLDAADVVWLLGDWVWRRIDQNILNKKYVITTVHHLVPDKFGISEQAEFKERDQFVDLYHVPCYKTAKQIKNLTEKPIWVMPFWVNQSIWKKIDITNLHQKHNLPIDKFLIGSFQRDTEGKDLVSPKLEKGPDLFCDAVEQINDVIGNVHVVLAGWRRQYVMNRLKKSRIEFTYFHLPSFETVNELYNCLNLYVVAARYEGGPQAIIECAANETPIISTDVGLASMILRNDDIFEPGEAVKAFQRKRLPVDVSKFFIPSGFEPFRKIIQEI